MLGRVKLSLKLKIIAVHYRTVSTLTLPTDSQMEAHVWAQPCRAGSSFWEDCTAGLAVTVGGGNVFICLFSLLPHTKLA